MASLRGIYPPGVESLLSFVMDIQSSVKMHLGVLLSVALLAGLGAAPARAQDPGGPPAAPLEPPTARVAVMDVALYNAQANLQEPTDAEKAALADSVLHATLARLLPGQLADSAEVRSAAGADSLRALRGDQRCDVIVACARAVGRSVGASWVVLAKVSKTSNLIWLLSAQLVHVPTGEIVLDDSTELKGDPAPMVRAGTRIFAERVARTVRAGGRTTNFPSS
jgi:hypothetical protein